MNSGKFASLIFLSLTIAACNTPPKIVRLSKEPNAAIIYPNSQRSSLLTWEGAYINKVDNEIVGADQESPVYISPGNHTLSVSVRFNRGIGGGGPIFTEINLPTNLKMATEYNLRQSNTDSTYAVWLEDKATGERVGNQATADRPKPSPKPAPWEPDPLKISIRKKIPEYVVASNFQKRKDQFTTIQSAILIGNLDAPDHITPFNKEQKNRTLQEDQEKPKEIDGFFTSIKDLNDQSKITSLLIACDGANCRFGSYLELLPGTYEIGYSCGRDGGNVAPFEKTLTILAGKKYHFICTLPNPTRHIASLFVAETDTVETSSLPDYYSHFKFK
jgi:hypothetical protein